MPENLSTQSSGRDGVEDVRIPKVRRDEVQERTREVLPANAVRLSEGPTFEGKVRNWKLRMEEREPRSLASRREEAPPGTRQGQKWIAPSDHQAG